MKTIIITILLTILSIDLIGNGFIPEDEKGPTARADSLLQTLSLEEKIGQLLMLTSYPTLGASDEQLILSLINQYKVGGVLFLKSSPHALSRLCRTFQSASKVPLFTALDAENGLSFRMDSVPTYPNLMTLGAISDDSLLYRMGREIGQQFKALGLNMNFAPVADINSNPDNTIINFRSFGENPDLVAHKSLMLARGMQDENIRVVCKHFPGHGDTSTDSHHTLPVINHTYARLDTVELVPFRKLIRGGVDGIMSAHIHLSQFEKEVIPATMSSKIMKDLLRDSLQFAGLLISDAMNMKGISAKYSESQATVMALKAGIDMVEFISRPGEVIEAVKEAIRKGILTVEEIDQKCRKVLLAKSGLGKNQAIKPDSLTGFLSSKRFELTARRLFEQSLTLVRDQNNLIPFQRLDTLKLATLTIGENIKNQFQLRIDNYLEADHYNLSAQLTPEQLNHTFNELQNYNMVLVSLHNNQMYPGKKYALSELQIRAIEKAALLKNAVFLVFGNVYSLKYLPNAASFGTLVLAYENRAPSQDLAAQMLFGAIGSKGKVPVSLHRQFKSGDGITTQASGRLKYGLPEELGISSKLLEQKADSMINQAISKRFFPGCQVLVAQKGTVFFDKAYGFHTYDSTTQVNKNHLYDLASVTKIFGPLPLIMKMTEEGKLKLDEPFSRFYPGFNTPDKQMITLRELLTHQAGLKPSLLFHSQLIDKKGQLKSEWIRTNPSDSFTIDVAPRLFLNKNFPIEMKQQINNSTLLKKKKYTYSDLGFLLFPEMLETLSAKKYENWLSEEIYAPMGIVRLVYQPWKKIPVSECPPTEEDYLFRKSTVAGYVHDESAALMGGISGNAGLFGNTGELAKIAQLYLQGGVYGDFRLVSRETITNFSRRQYPNSDNRRALGFDKPYPGHEKLPVEKSNLSPLASAFTYGHTGFTGTVVWIDPGKQLLFIFLSNRTYPDRSTRITLENFRPRLHHLFYELQNTFCYSCK